MSLDVEAIIAADYRTISNVACIYAEAQTGEYTLRYWIGVDSGLLVAAEKLLGDETVYRMLSLTVDQTEPTAAEFTLPDGTFFCGDGMPSKFQIENRGEACFTPVFMVLWEIEKHPERKKDAPHL